MGIVTLTLAFHARHLLLCVDQSAIRHRRVFQATGFIQHFGHYMADAIFRSRRTPRSLVLCRYRSQHLVVVDSLPGYEIRDYEEFEKKLF